MTYNLCEEYLWKAEVDVLFDLEHVSPFLFLHRGNSLLFVPNTITETLYHTIRKTKNVLLAFYSDCTIVTLKIGYDL